MEKNEASWLLKIIMVILGVMIVALIAALIYFMHQLYLGDYENSLQYMAAIIVAFLTVFVSIFLGIMVYMQTKKLNAIDKKIAENNVKYSAFNYLDIKTVTLEIGSDFILDNLPGNGRASGNLIVLVPAVQRGHEAKRKTYNRLVITITGSALEMLPIMKIDVEHFSLKIDNYQCEAYGLTNIAQKGLTTTASGKRYEFHMLCAMSFEGAVFSLHDGRIDLTGSKLTMEIGLAFVTIAGVRLRHIDTVEFNDGCKNKEGNFHFASIKATTRRYNDEENKRKILSMEYDE